MRTVISHGMPSFAGEQPPVIDVTPRSASVNLSWWQRARMALWVLLGAIMFPVVLLLASVAGLALLGIGGLAVAVIGLRLRNLRRRMRVA